MRRTAEYPVERKRSSQSSSVDARRFVVAFAVCCSLGALRADDRAEFFRQQVEPILRTHCYECHSHKSGTMESGLALDWKSGWATGGQRGPAIVPGQPDASLLIQAVRHHDPKLKMPEEPLADRLVATLVRWVEQGAFDDRAARPAASDPLEWWSLKPLVAPPAPAGIERASDESPNPIDAFIQAKLSARNLSESPPAPPRELMRRLHFDLVGLPPSPEETDRFVADPGPSAYRQLVDRLLDSPRHGERWARHWFDAIHFADSHGYEHDVGRDHAWPYRDYVIHAFNNDVPWATFIRQQLAVDHFEPDATHLRPALGFLGAGTFDLSTYSTGPVTFDYLDRDDMLTQTMAAFTSTTANCARCHSHKFDPISQEDYYALQAVFAGVLKGDISYDADSNIGAERRRLNEWKAAATARDANMLLTAAVRERTERWIARAGTLARWTPLEPQSFISTDGAVLTRQPDGTVLASGPSPDVDTYVVSATSSLSKITAIRLDLFPHESLPAKGPGRCQNGNLHLSDVRIAVFEPGATAGRTIAIARATADFNQAGWTIDHAIDDNVKTAWGIYPAVAQPHHAVFEFVEPIALKSGMSIAVTLRQLHGGSHLIGAFQLSATDAPAEQTVALPRDVALAMATSASERTTEQQLDVAAYVVRIEAEADLARLPEQSSVFAVGTSVNIPNGNGKYASGRIPAPKTVNLLHRGAIDQPRAVAEPGALAALRHAPGRFASSHMNNEAARRAALADWIAHRDNVLTWRSVVNRVWQHHFGRGLCDTPSDFGRMGGEPSHPELIDWLAVWFRDEAKGSLKSLHRLIVTSRVYRQSSQSRGDAEAIDGGNRLLWRQNRQRLDADSYRDAVLAVSGRIDFTMGGPAIQHFLQSPGPQATPKLDYASYDWSSPGSNRRSIYRCVWRGIPDPLMAALDFPDLGLLSPTRGFSASPLQALALYNNPFVLFHSEATARRIQDAARDASGMVREATRLTLGRDPSEREAREFASYVDHHGLAAFCRLLFNSNEFLFIP